MNCINNTFEYTPTEAVEPGNYVATFNGIETVEGKFGEQYKFTFTTKDGKSLIGYANVPPAGPRKCNRFGQFLCGLAGAPADKAGKMNPAEYVGKTYLVLFGSVTSPQGESKVKMTAITPTG